jgi:hypothetical protein
MSDHELLALAAKAAGRTLGPEWDCYNVGIWVDGTGKGDGALWSPLTDDGDALRLAFLLNIHIALYGEGTGITTYVIPDGEDAESFHQDHVYDLASVRRAIVRAAAFIGSKMP